LLSYRHAFHAGNFADVLKHSVLTLVLEYMTRKDKGFYYIDSHSGAGMYSLEDEYAQKTGEFKNGIAKLVSKDNIPEPLQPYIEIIKTINDTDTISNAISENSSNNGSNELNLYPGSPAIAKYFDRRQDSAHLFELHPTDFSLLSDYCHRWNKSHVNQTDGYQGVLGLIPPPNRRAVVLIDPPYELKDDYKKAVSTIIKGYKKFATGTYILWYPVVKRDFIDGMELQLTNSDIKNVIQVEYCQSADTQEYGMTGTGLFIVNPPWQLKKQLSEILPYLKEVIGDDMSHYCINQLIEE